MIRFSPTVLALAAMLAGCTLMPTYQQPATPVPAAFADASGNRDNTGDGARAPVAVADLGWRDVFTDPSLQRVIEMALANNRDLRVAILNIERARSIACRTLRCSPRSRPAAARAAAARRPPCRPPGNRWCRTPTAPRSASAPTSWTCSAACAASIHRRWNRSSPPSRCAAAARSA
uniref:Uncharacterized protein n=1 Tax=blood disease bacterium R229 TaxID=741978 RepID=G2ZWE0_9RALS|nr:exported hypothetical protein [blood disease bacterium R229]